MQTLLVSNSRYLKWMLTLSLPLLAGLGISACVKESSAPNTDALVQEWKSIPKAGYQGMQTKRAEAISAELAKSGMAGLSPILDVLGDAKGDPVSKVLAVMCLTPYLSPEFAPRLLEMTREDQETTTRVCATHLLSFLTPPEVQQRIKELVNDKERRVKMEASLALMMNNDADVLKHVAELWKNPETTASERSQMMLVFPEQHAPEYMDLIKEAAKDENLEIPARTKAVSILGRIGDASVLDVLTTCAEKDPYPNMRSLAQNAVEAIKARTQAPGADAAPAAPTAPAAPAAPAIPPSS